MPSLIWFNWRYKTGQMSRHGAHYEIIRPQFAAMAAPLVMSLAIAIAASDVRAGGASGPGSAGAGPSAGAEAAPLPPGGDARPEYDADASDLARPRDPRPRDDSDRAPRLDEGCPYRGRKLDLIV